LEKNLLVGAGSVITKNVRKGSLVLARAKQIEKKKYK
jgi:bifunctional N-acetylglucosamine-1-phosphate-uridyltransferase/glucosamine-1-phosphate-acetyltransferase GlmU-like protein